MRSIIFGATGFFGSHVVEQLAAAGHEVVTIVRWSSDVSFLETTSARIVRSDFSDEALAGELTAGDVVYNCIADVRMHLERERHREVEVLLTERLLRASAAAGASRFVQLSSVQTYGTALPPQAVDEDYPLRPVHDFQLTAVEREEAVRRVAAESGIEWVLARPSTTTGPRDTTLMRNLYPVHAAGRFPIFGEGLQPVTLVDARDVGRAMVLLGESPGAANLIFLVGGFSCSWPEIKAAMDRATGRPAKTMHLPVAPMRALARFLTVLTPRNREPFLHPLAVDTSSRPSAFDDSRLRRLGYAPLHDIDDAVGSAVEWIRSR